MGASNSRNSLRQLYAYVAVNDLYPPPSLSPKHTLNLLQLPLCGWYLFLAEFAREEIADLESQLAEAETQLKLLLLPKDPLDERNVMLEIR